MAQKYYNVKETAGMFGITEAEVKQMLDRRELYGYRDGADWKFKAEDIERIAKERASKSSDADDDDGDVLLSEVELGRSDHGLSGTVIGVEKSPSPVESDIRLAESDVKLAESTIQLVGSSAIDLGSEKTPAAGKDEMASKVSQFEELDLTLDQDLTLEESTVGVAKSKPADSAVDLSGKKLDDDDLVLGGSGTGSDIAIGQDSGISLVDPADSGLSLEAPLHLAGGDESLELGEDDLLAFSSDARSESDFQLTPMDEPGDEDDSESGSQVIALDTEMEGDETTTMVGVNTPIAAMLDEDMSSDPLMMAPAMSVGSGFEEQPGPITMGAPFMQPGVAMALPEAPYSWLNIISLVVCSLILMLVGMMMYDLLRNMWGWNSANPVNSAIMDTILSWFEK